MKKSIATIIGLSFIALASACGNPATPEGVCKTMEGFATDEEKKEAKDGDMDECAKMMKEWETKDKEGFGKMATCIVGAKDKGGAETCVKDAMTAQMAGGGDDKPAEEKPAE